MTKIAQSTAEPALAWVLDTLRAGAYWPPRGIGYQPAERVLAVARDEGVEMLVFHKARHAPVWDQLPEELRQKLRQITFRATAREALLHDEVTRDLDALASHGIQALLLKGTALAHTVYPSPELRPRCDVDILLADKVTAEQAWGILSGLGYERGTTISGDFVSHQYTCARRVSPREGVVLDVHWKLSNSNFFAGKFGFEELRSERIPVRPLGPNAFGLSLPHALVHALFHRIWHLGDGESERLIWLYDIDLICRHLSQGQWTGFAELVASRDLGPICQDGLARSVELYGTPLPDGTLERLAPADSPSKRQMIFGEPGWRRALADLQSLPAWPQRLRALREQVLPDQRYMQRRFGATGYAGLTFAYLKRLRNGGRRLLRRRS